MISVINLTFNSNPTVGEEISLKLGHVKNMVMQFVAEGTVVVSPVTVGATKAETMDNFVTAFLAKYGTDFTCFVLDADQVTIRHNQDGFFQENLIQNDTSSIIADVLNGVPINGSPPSKVTGVVVTAVTRNQASIAWNPATDDNGVVGYKVYLNGTPYGNTTGTSILVTGLTSDTTYTATVLAYDADTNEGELSDGVNFTTLLNIPDHLCQDNIIGVNGLAQALYAVTKPYHRTTKGDEFSKFRVNSIAARDALITDDRILKGHIIYFDNGTVDEFPRSLYFLKCYPTHGSLEGAEWYDILSNIPNIEDELRWSNHLKEWSAETIKSAMGEVIRAYNGNLYKYQGGNYPFNTVDIQAEIVEGKWKPLISTFPPVEFAVVTPKSIKPNITRFVQINASNLKIGTTVDFGADITVLSYQYVSESLMYVELQSNGNYGSVFPKINNGIEVTLPIAFSISDGDLYVPDALGSEWSPRHSEVIYSLGGFEAQLNGSRYIGSFGISVPVAQDCELSFKVIDTTYVNEQLYFGFKTDPNDATVTGDGIQFRMYHESGEFGHGNNASGYTPPNPIPDSILTFKKIMQTPTTAKIEIFQNGVKFGEYPSIDVLAPWFPYFYAYTPYKVTEIELLIL